MLEPDFPAIRERHSNFSNYFRGCWLRSRGDRSLQCRHPCRHHRRVWRSGHSVISHIYSATVTKPTFFAAHGESVIARCRVGTAGDGFKSFAAANVHHPQRQGSCQANSVAHRRSGIDSIEQALACLDEITFFQQGAADEIHDVIAIGGSHFGHSIQCHTATGCRDDCLRSAQFN